MSQSPDRLLELRRLFDIGIELPETERTTWLASIDETFRGEVAALLDSANDETRPDRQIVPHSPATAAPGQRIGPYQVVRLIGQGGMGAVYEAVRRDDQYQKRVAIKLVQRGLDSELTMARFRRERQILANLGHRNIATLLDGGVTEDGRPFLVMEYVEGEPITQWCDQRRKSTTERIALLRQVCSAVHHAHRNLVIHRDIKPGNILVTEDGTVKLLDFGIAKLLGEVPDDAGLPLTRGDNRALTPEYASPEQWRAEPLSTASDIYSLGVASFELLAGRRPHIADGPGIAALERAVIEGTTPRPSTVVTDAAAIVRGERNAARLKKVLEGELDDVLLTALHPLPQSRYPSAEALGEDFRRYLTGLPLAARRDWTAYRIRKFVRRNRAGVAASGLAVVALITGIITTTRAARRAVHEQAKTEQVNAFLGSILSSVSTETGGRDVPVSELLDSAAVRLGVELANQPEVQAPIERVVATSYLRLGAYPAAEAHYKTALRLEQQISGPEGLGTIVALRELGQLYNAKGDYDRADTVLHQALTLHRKSGRGDDTVSAAILGSLGSISNNRGDMKAAEQYHRESYEIYRKVLPGEDDRVPEEMNNLAVALGYQARYVEAESLQRQVLSTLVKWHPDSTTAVADALDALASLLDMQGKDAPAESMFVTTLALRKKLLGPRHPAYIWTLMNYALRQYDFKEYVGAEAHAREVLALRGKELPDSHPAIAAMLQLLGRCLDLKGDHAGAEHALTESLAIRKQFLGEESWLVGSSDRVLGEHYQMVKNYPMAEATLLEGDRILRKARGETHPTTIQIARSLLALYTATGQKEKAAVQAARIPAPKK